MPLYLKIKSTRILPAKYFVRNLIMKNELRLHHCSPIQLLSTVQHKFWPLNGRREANKVIKACLPCYHFRPIFPEVKMSDLSLQKVADSHVRINWIRLCWSLANQRESTTWKDSHIKEIHRSFYMLQHESRTS